MITTFRHGNASLLLFHLFPHYAALSHVTDADINLGGTILHTFYSL